MKLYHFQKVAHPVHFTLDMSSNLEKIMDMAAKGAYQLLQHHVCHDYKTSERRNGIGGVHHRHNAHKLDLIPKMDEIEHVKPDEDRSSKCDKVTKIDFMVRIALSAKLALGSLYVWKK